MGYTVYVEVPLPHGARKIDIVGRKDKELICVELKMSLSRGVIHQASLCRMATPKVYAAVSRKPRLGSLTPASEQGIGVLLVNETVKVVKEPTEVINLDYFLEGYCKRMHQYLDHMPIGGIGGKPCLKGVGPAKECGRRVIEYLKVHPDAKWKDIYKDVPNHYASANSMYGAMNRWGNLNQEV